MRYKICNDRIRAAIEGGGRLVRIPDDEVERKIQITNYKLQITNQITNQNSNQAINKNNYTYSSGIPFGDLRVGEYYDYQTALCGGEAYCIKQAFEIVGLKVNRRKPMRKLSIGEYRQVQTAVRLRCDTAGVIADSINRRMQKAMRARGYKVISNKDMMLKNHRVSQRKLDKILADRGLRYLTTGS